jgi:hypothetical protein
VVEKRHHELAPVVAVDNADLVGRRQQRFDARPARAQS